MPLSLRFVLGGLSALLVTLVASITLGIALSTSFAALNSLGERHAIALLSAATDATVGMFAKGTGAVDNVVQLVHSEDWPRPSESNRSLAVFRGAAHTAFIAGASLITSFQLLFADNTRIAISVRKTAPHLYELFEQRVTPYSTTYPNQTIYPSQADVYERDTHAGLGPSTTEQSLWKPAQNRVWSQLNLATFNANFASVYTPFSTSSVLGVQSYLSMVSPMYLPSVTQRGIDHVFGFFIVSMDYRQLDGYLNRVRSTANAAVVAYDSGGFLLGTSVEQSIETMTPVDEWRGNVPPGCVNTNDYASTLNTTGVTQYIVCRHHLSTFPHSSVNSVADAASQLFPELDAQHLELVTLPGTGRAFVATTRIRLNFRGLELYLLVVMPEVDVLGDVVTGRNVAIGVTCGLIVLAAMANVALVWILLAPLGDIAVRMQRAANLEDDDADATLSAMAEVAELQEAYNEMNAELNRIRSYVPQSVLEARKVARGVADDEGDLDITTATVEDDSKSVASSRRSTRSRRSPGVSARGSPMGIGGKVTPRSDADAMSLRPVSVIAANVVGLHHTCTSAEAVERQIAAAAAAVESTVTANHGVLTFHGDRFLATFNAARPCAGHAVKAARAAAALLAIDNAVLKHGRLSCGVATGPCVVGPVGSANVKTYSVVGVTVTNAALLERLTKLHGEGRALATHRTCMDAQATIGIEFVDFVALPGKDGRVRPTAVAVLHAPAHHGSDGSNAHPSAPAEAAAEWMYVMQQGGAHNAPLNACFDELQRGHLDECRAILDQFEAASGDSANRCVPPRLTEIAAKLRAGAKSTAELCRSDLGPFWPVAA